jgi:hypothetical protein
VIKEAKMIKNPKIPFRTIKRKFPKIEQIMRDTGEIKCVCQYLKINKSTFREYRKEFPELEAVIANSSKSALIEEKINSPEVLHEIERILSTGLKKDAAKYLNVKQNVFANYIKKFPALSLVVENALKKRPPKVSIKATLAKAHRNKALAKVERKGKKGLSRKKSETKIPKELVVDIHTVEDTSEAKLATYFKKKAAEREADLQKQVRSDFRDMI